MNIKEIKGYDEFKKHCSFELCTKHYPDWTGSEKYIVITDDEEKDLLDTFPEIMKALSPYVIIGRYFAKMNDDMRYNDFKSAASSFSLDQIDDYENISDELIASDFSESLCNKDVVSRALFCLTEIQRSRIQRFFYAEKTLKEIALEDGVGTQSIFDSISSALEKMKSFLSKRP